MTFTLIRRLLVVVAVLALASASCFASTCATGTSLTAYLTMGGGGCTIGNALFANFTYSFTGSPDTGSGNPVLPDPTADVTVNTIPGPDTGPVGLNFAFANNNFVLTGQTMNLDIQYTVTVDVTDFPAYSGYVFNLVTTGVAGDQASTGTGTATKNLCLGSAFSTPGGDDSANCGGTFVGASVGNNSFDLSGVSYSGSGTLSSFAPTALLGISDSIQLAGGAAGDGIADITSMSNEFSDANGEVPEPATLLLIGSALMGLGILRRKRA